MTILAQVRQKKVEVIVDEEDYSIVFDEEEYENENRTYNNKGSKLSNLCFPEPAREGKKVLYMWVDE